MTNKKVKTMLQVFQIKDLTTKTFGRPICFSNEDHAKAETLKHFLLQDPKEDLDPSKFELHYMGEYDESTGDLFFKPCTYKICLISDIAEKEMDNTLETIRSYKLELIELKKQKNELVKTQLQKETL